ncbi:MAG: hypothetical protein RL367_815, partial [Pseudomonadota bacterium]
MQVVRFKHDRTQILTPIVVMSPSDDNSMRIERASG